MSTTNLKILLFSFQIIILLISLNKSNGQLDSTALRKFEYKYSFKPPYLSQKDGTIPFWEYTGNAIASEENLRITPSLRSQKGSIWTRQPTNFQYWEIELVFRITGRGRVGADGLAFWFIKERGIEGPVFGSSDKWNGLGIFFDSFDNDNKHNNPYILAMLNDGTKEFEHSNDGSTQQLAGCLRDFRNKPFPVRTKITYYKNVLTVLFNNGMSNNENDYELCLRVENVLLPETGYFGLSAATGGLADDHDVSKFMTWSITQQSTDFGSSGGNNLGQIPNDEQIKFEQEFNNYQNQLNLKKEEYIKEHPESALKKEQNEEDWYEEEQIRELRQIFQGQSELRGLVQNLNKKLDEIVGRQETTLSIVTNIQSSSSGAVVQKQQGQPQGAGAGGVNYGPTSPLQRHEVDNLLAASRELIASSREIKNMLVTIGNKQESQQPVASYGAGTGAGAGNTILDYTNNFNELKEGLNTIKRDVSLVQQKVFTLPVQGQQGQQQGQQIQSCPQITCASNITLIIFFIIQILLLLIYNYWKSKSENNSKKFY